MSKRFILPDYSNCGLNVACSVLRHYGAAIAHPTHPVVDRLLAGKRYKNVVLMLFDGMGMRTLAEHLPPNAFLNTHIACEMTAVFPSTTVAATTTIESGDAPCEHAWLGWSMYFHQMNRIVDVFINRDTLTGEPVTDYRVTARYIPYKTICERLHEAGGVQASIVSRYGTVCIDTLDDLFDTALSLCRAEGRQYIYTYWGEPDHTMHDIGCVNDEIQAIARDINARMEAFCEAVGEDTLVLATADHGLIDCEQVYVCDDADLPGFCVRPPCVEPRAAAFYVKPEKLADFPAAFEKAFGREHFLLMKSDEALEMGLFGKGARHPALRGFLGDYMAIAIDKFSIMWDRSAHIFAGMHAGLTPQEMRVPLIVGRA